MSAIGPIAEFLLVRQRPLRCNSGRGAGQVRTSAFDPKPPFLRLLLSEGLDRSIEVPILPRGFALQLRFRPRLVFEAHDEERLNEALRCRVACP
jgi:hypothetical protein